MNAVSRKIHRAFTGGCLLMCICVPQAHAFNVFEFFGDPSQASKWGTSNTVGTPGGVVTWSLMPNGTTLAPGAPDYIHGTSNLTSVFDQVGGQAAAVGWINRAFAAWSSVANISFVQVSDDGTPFNAAYEAAQLIGDIRIGAFQIDGFSGAVGFAPRPNGGTTLEGDIIFNSNNTFGVAAGAEGGLYELYPASNNFFYFNDFPGLVTHEMGHALGLAHSDVPSALMCGFVSAAFDGSQCDYLDPDGDGKATINRIPDADDVAGIQHLYGPAPVPEPGTYALLLAGLALLGVVARRKR